MSSSCAGSFVLISAPLASVGAHQCVVCLLTGLLSQDGLDPTTVEFWLRTFVDQAQKAKWTEGEEPQVARLFTKFVVKRMIHAECLGSLPVLVRQLNRLGNIVPQLLPPATGALVTLASDDVVMTGAIDFGDMPLSARNEFVDSPLYKQFLQVRIQR